MKRRKRREEVDNSDRWVIPYADFITLLFAFFTTLYAISHVDSVKLDRFAGSMKTALRAPVTKPNTSAIIDGIKPINYGDAKLEKDIRSEFAKSGIIDTVSISRDERGVHISLDDAVLFELGSAEIKTDAQPFLAAVAGIIRQTQNTISIEGHTDNTPIKNSRYASNWELSTARATSVLITLLRNYQLNPERFSASGYGEHHPIASNVSPDGRAKNRRVDIIFDTRKEGT